MRKGLRWKSILVVLVTGLSIFLAYPPQKKINLGLDLKGGIHLVLQVMTDDALNTEANQEILRLEEQMKKKNLEYKNITPGIPGRFAIQEINPDQEGQIKDLLDENFKEWNYIVSGRSFALSLKPQYVTMLRGESVTGALETIRSRVDELGLSEPTIQRQGGMSGERIIVELPGVEDPERVKNILKTTALLEWKLVKAGPAADQETLLKDFGGQVPEGEEVLRGDPKRTEGGYYLVSRVPAISGKDLKNARRSVDEWNNPAVSFTLSPEAGRRFYKFTSDNLEKPLAVVLDGKIQQVATIKAQISESGIIHGRFTPDEADDIALVLRAGALPASIKILETRAIGPALGVDSIRKGLSAGIVALILVVFFMVIYYRLAGLNAVVALVLNMVILGGVLAYFKATLTLPGIAGIILTIGMAVDANVLIFERIREELAAGKSVLSSIVAGFSRALSAIVDSNLTTVISAIFLFQFGTGPVKGYAVTLIIGIMASMFTAVFVSHLIFDLTVSGKKGKKLSI
jgi:preprotein translocase subunit SecD